MNRRMRDENGKIALRPNPQGFTYTDLPIILFKDLGGKPVSLLFSIACHPSTIKGDARAYQISADYPGVAMNIIDRYLGGDACLFLQGAGGNSKASVIGKGEKDWRSGTWKDVDDAGTMAANEVIHGMNAGLTRINPELATQMVISNFALAPSLSRQEYESIFKDSKTAAAMRLWAQEQMTLLDRGFQLPASVPVTVHGIQLGKGLRIIGIEGELVAELGLLVKEYYRKGVTFALGYSDGAQLYIPTSTMLDEGGYEVESYWEYRQPAPLSKGIEDKITEALNQLQKSGIK
jgi:neutral ceramidase